MNEVLIIIYTTASDITFGPGLEDVEYDQSYRGVYFISDIYAHRILASYWYVWPNMDNLPFLVDDIYMFRSLRYYAFHQIIALHNQNTIFYKTFHLMSKINPPFLSSFFGVANICNVSIYPVP